SPGRRSGDADRRDADPGFVAILASRPIRTRRSSAEFRQAIRSRLPRTDPLEQAAACPDPAGGGRRQNAGQVHRGLPPPHRPGARMISDRLERLVEEMVDKGVQFDDAVREFEKRFIVRVLGKVDGSLTRTADALGMHRNTLTRKMVEYMIKRR